MKFKQLVAVILAVGFLVAGTTTSAFAAKKSFSYKTGFNWILESNRNDLASFGIEKVFGINGQPVLRKVKLWCNEMPMYMLRRPPSVGDWVKGCTAATMSISLRQFG
jgi:hypothetical protein